MKTVVTLLVFGTCIFLGYKLDVFIYDLIIEQIPQNDWLGFIKIVIGIILFFLTAGIIIGLSSALTLITGKILGLTK